MHSVVTSEKTPFRSFEAARNDSPRSLTVPCHIAIYSTKGRIRHTDYWAARKMPLPFVLPLSLLMADG